MAGISSLTTTISTEVKWTAQNNLTGGAYNPTTNSGDIRKNYNVGTAAANGASGGADEFFSFQQSVAAGSSATLDLTQMTNILQQATVNIARIKGYQIRLLSASDDTTISPAPTATSTGLVTNNPPSSQAMDVPCALDFGNGGSGLTLTLTTSSGAVTSVAIGAAGSGYPKSSTFLVAPNQAGGSAAVVAVTTNSSGVPTTVALVAGAGGAGYTNATVPTTVLGQHFLYTGGAAMYFDVSAAGFCTVGSTGKKIGLLNLDGSNAVTFEIDVVAATT